MRSGAFNRSTFRSSPPPPNLIDRSPHAPTTRTRPPTLRSPRSPRSASGLALGQLRGYVPAKAYAGGEVAVGAHHPGCVEARNMCPFGCEYDGRVSVTRFRGQYLMYVRANLRPGGGGRWVQVTRAPSAHGPWGSMEVVSMAEYDACMAVHGNVYAANIKPNPADGGRSVLGVFPMCGPERPQGMHGPTSARTSGYMGLAVSCDGVRFGKVRPVLRIRKEWAGRPSDLPVDGMVYRPAVGVDAGAGAGAGADAAYLFIHCDMPHDYTRTGRSRIVRHRLSLEALKAFTDESKRALGEACDAQGLEGRGYGAGSSEASVRGAPGPLNLTHDGKSWRPGPPGTCPYFN